MVKIFIPHIFVVGAFLMKVSLLWSITLLFSNLCDVSHFLSCFIDLLLYLRQPKHFLPSLLHLLVYGFKVADLLIQLLDLWGWASSLPFFGFGLPVEGFRPDWYLEEQEQPLAPLSSSVA
jgi:hypothetical protein